MPDTVRRTEHIWAFGKPYVFRIYDCGVALQAASFNNQDQQKNLIVLHSTDANNTALQTVNYWNTLAGLSVASSHYIVEMAEDRLNGAAQPYSDVIEVVDSSKTSFNVWGFLNSNCIGIEHANTQDYTTFGSVRDTLALPVHPADSNPANRLRPQNYNRWLHVPTSVSHTLPKNESNLDFPADVQALQEEQYLAIILLLRHLCIKHRIPRRFLGETLFEKMRRWWNYHKTDVDSNGNALHPDITTPLQQSKLLRFRGILSHVNCHWDKLCGGPGFHHNRIFRGIIEEWWMPVQLQGAERGYHTGPFAPPNVRAVDPNNPSYLRWTTAGLQHELFHNADMAALHETTSYFNLDHLPWYFASAERPDLGGTFPIGTNKSWHGGVHLSPDPANLKVYAAASGTIVAARMGGDLTTESDPSWGSQRFVLIRHAVFLQTQASPDGRGVRINYDNNPDPPVDGSSSNNPKLIFTLYMHLAPLARPDVLNVGNPPWFNYWLRHGGTAADSHTVFFPDVEVSVGDWLGSCGTYHGKTMMHFEVMSKDELTMAPWDRADHRAEDKTDSAICSVPKINQFVNAHGATIDTMDMVAAAPQLRTVKSFHKSEWAMSSSDALIPALPGDYLKPLRDVTWETRLKHFMWVSDAVAANGDLSSQLCDAKGMMWHYHPIKFMEFVNNLVLQENGHVSEPDARNTNVNVEDGYLTDFVNFPPGTAPPVPAAADPQPVKPFDVHQAGFGYHFNRDAVACSAPTAHNPPGTPMRTKFHLTLLDVLEDIRKRNNDAPITLGRAHLCAGHSADNPANRALCVLGTARALQKHAAGLAADIRPATPNPASCRALWNAAFSTSGSLNSSCSDHAGEPSRADLSVSDGGIQKLQLSTSPDAVQRKLTAGTALTAAEAAACILHLELILESIPSLWTCWIKKNTKATAVQLEMFPMPNIVGTFSTQGDALAEQDLSSPAPSDDGSGGWRVVIRQNSLASDTRIQAGGIVGIYSQFSHAENEKELGSDEPWPEEGSAETN
jgi:N-acetylmuramoyl-L-alanine amidase